MKTKARRLTTGWMKRDGGSYYGSRGSLCGRGLLTYFDIPADASAIRFVAVQKPTDSSSVIFPRVCPCCGQLYFVDKKDSDPRTARGAVPDWIRDLLTSHFKRLPRTIYVECEYR